MAATSVRGMTINGLKTGLQLF